MVVYAVHKICMHVNVFQYCDVSERHKSVIVAKYFCEHIVLLANIVDRRMMWLSCWDFPRVIPMHECKHTLARN